MPKYDKVVITETAQKHGFLTASFEKMTRLMDVLRFINERNTLRDSLALKGGTAINLTIFNVPRLSVDIDLDFTNNLTRDETKVIREKIGNLIETYMTAEGYYRNKKSKQTHILDSFVYSYTNIAENIDNIKIEINYSLRAHVLPYIEKTTLS